MNKIKSLLNALLSQDMQIFKYKAKSTDSKSKKLLFIVFLAAIVLYSVGIYAYIFAEQLSKSNLTYVMLTLFIIVVTVLSFMEGLYKSQGMLFDCKDNDLLFSLPISKRLIFFLRITKLLIFQFLYNLLFILPAFAVYIYFENPGITFYIVSLIMLFLIPLIPTVLSGILGYIIKMVSLKFKSKKIMQTILSLGLLLLFFSLSFNMEGFVNNIVSKATSINELLTKIYYPAAIYVNLINKFDVLLLIKLVLINVVPLVVFVYLGSIFYNKIIFKSKESIKGKRVKNVNSLIKVNSQIKALIIREFKRFINSPVYILNSSFGLILIVLLTISLSLKSDKLLASIIEIDPNIIKNNIVLVYYALIIIASLMVYITSSIISLEGKKITISKSLPVSEKKILLSKVLFSVIITLPFLILSDIIFIISFKVTTLNIIYIILLTIILPFTSSLIGIIINLKFPKMIFNNDTEVVKQSVSCLVSVFFSMALSIASIFLMIKFIKNINICVLLMIIAFLLINIILYYILNTYGVKKYRKISI